MQEDTAAEGVDTAAEGVDTAAEGVDTAAEGVDTAAVDATRNAQHLLYPVCIPLLLGVIRLARTHPTQLSSTKTP